MRRGLRIALRRARRPVKPRVALAPTPSTAGRRAGHDGPEDDEADEHGEGAEPGPAHGAVGATRSP